MKYCLRYTIACIFLKILHETGLLSPPPPPPPPLLPSLYKPCCKVSKFLFSRIKNFKYWSLVSLNTLFKFSWEDHGPWLLILIISLCYLYVNFKLAVTIIWSEGNISSAILPLTVSKASCSKVIVMKYRAAIKQTTTIPSALFDNKNKTLACALLIFAKHLCINIFMRMYKKNTTVVEYSTKSKIKLLKWSESHSKQKGNSQLFVSPPLTQTPHRHDPWGPQSWWQVYLKRGP